LIYWGQNENFTLLLQEDSENIQFTKSLINCKDQMFFKFYENTMQKLDLRL